VPKWCKLIVAILLLPVCIGAAIALWKVSGRERQRGHDLGGDPFRRSLLGVIYLLLPKPMWIYVFGHELTHAVWTWLMGGRVKKFKASSKAVM